MMFLFFFRGNNSYGEIANDSTTTVRVPVVIKSLNQCVVKALSAGYCMI